MKSIIVSAESAHSIAKGRQTEFVIPLNKKRPARISVGDEVIIREPWRVIGWDFEDDEITVKYNDGVVVCLFGHELDWLVNYIDRLERKGVIDEDEGTINPEEGTFRYKFLKEVPVRSASQMPLFCGRTLVKIVDFHVGPVQDIDEEGARRAGIECFTKDNRLYKYGVEGWKWADHWKGKQPLMQRTAREAFALLFDQVNGAGEWAKNPQVCTIKFKIEFP